MKAPRFEIFKSDKDGQFYFRLRAKNNRIILQSEGYTQKHNAEHGIYSVQKTSQDLPHYQIFFFWVDKSKTEPNDKKGWWFRLKGFNGEIIGRSETYTTKAGAKRGIASVRKNAPIAEIVDLTKD